MMQEKSVTVPWVPTKLSEKETPSIDTSHLSRLLEYDQRMGEWLSEGWEPEGQRFGGPRKEDCRGEVK